MACTGICHRYKKPGRCNYGTPASGFCTECRVMIEWKGMKCPCCGYNIRRKPRVDKSKEAKRRQRRGREGRS